MNATPAYAQLQATIGYTDADRSPGSTPVGTWGHPFALTADHDGRSIGLHFGTETVVDKIELWCAGLTVIGQQSAYRLYASGDNATYAPIESFVFRSRVIEGRTVSIFELPGIRAPYIKIHIPPEESRGLFPIRLLQFDVRAYRLDFSVGPELKALVGFLRSDTEPESGSLADWGGTATFPVDVNRNSVGIDFGRPTNVGRIDLTGRHSGAKGDGSGRQYKLYASMDNALYEEIPDAEFQHRIDNFRLVHSFVLTGVTARYLKVNTLYADDESFFELYDNPQFRVKAYGPAHSPLVGSASRTDGRPFAIGSQTELFVSRDLVETVSGIAFRQIPGEKHGDRPLLSPDRDWEGYRQVLWGDVLYDEQERLFKMWYYTDTGGDKTYFANRWQLLYATSPDGIHWDKPPTRTATRCGKPTNAVSIADGAEMASVTKDLSAPAAERYKMVTFTWQKGYHTMVSPDGIEWTFFGSIGEGHDVSTAVWDRYRGQYVVLHKYSITDQGYYHPVRRFLYTTTSRDFKTWTPSFRSLNADASDQLIDRIAEKLEELAPLSEIPINRSLMRTDFYGAGLYPHESGMIAFPWVFYVNDEEAYHYTIDDGIDDVQLAFSRDTVNWTREIREPIIRRGRIRTAGPDAAAQDNAAVSDWDSGWIYTASKAIDVRDEVWLYYNGSNYTHDQKAHYYETYPEGHPQAGRSSGRFDPRTGGGAFKGEIGLVKWKRDRFVAAEAGDGEGTLTTKPVSFSGGQLVVNASVADGGYLLAELLEPDGTVIPGFGAGDCLPVRGDSLGHRIEWTGRKSAAAWAGRAVKLRFIMKRAELFAYKFSD
ncbi:discoidin domain-containing protein [Paenibacillus sp. GYB003]|uniref:discoidin domain-containing protein n=1 Tax=Paenibacillus sp. GYB003 TaxID=2994392 RepID=UPI002F965C07